MLLFCFSFFSLPTIPTELNASPPWMSLPWHHLRQVAPWLIQRRWQVRKWHTQQHDRGPWTPFCSLQCDNPKLSESTTRKEGRNEKIIVVETSKNRQYEWMTDWLIVYLIIRAADDQRTTFIQNNLPDPVAVASQCLHTVTEEGEWKKKKKRMSTFSLTNQGVGKFTHPVPVSQILIDWSREDDSRVSPEGWKTTQDTLWSWPNRVFTHTYSFCRSQIFIVKSAEQVAASN